MSLSAEEKFFNNNNKVWEETWEVIQNSVGITVSRIPKLTKVPSVSMGSFLHVKGKKVRTQTPGCQTSWNCPSFATCYT